MPSKKRPKHISGNEGSKKNRKTDGPVIINPREKIMKPIIRHALFEILVKIKLSTNTLTSE
jgi:hypothetical protein